METEQELRRIYNQELGRGPFPLNECNIAKISGEEHGILVLYLADIAGLAARGERLSIVSEPDKTKFRELASRSLFERCPQLERKISPDTTPRLNTLIQATERARVLVLRVLAR